MQLDMGSITNRKYYVNRKTGESTSEKPADFQPAPARAAAAAAAAALGSTAPIVARAEAAWQKHLDKQSGRCFYHNIVTKQSEWTRPATEVVVHQQLKREYMKPLGKLCGMLMRVLAGGQGQHQQAQETELPVASHSQAVNVAAQKLLNSLNEALAVLRQDPHQRNNKHRSIKDLVKLEQVIVKELLPTLVTGLRISNGRLGDRLESAYVVSVLQASAAEAQRVSKAKRLGTA
jgi:hypothetical protein